MMTNPLLELIGAITCAFVAAVLIRCAIGGVKELILRQILKSKQKHRFDKSPIAKCYCIDCEKHCKDGLCCAHNGWNTADEWFCWDATPRKHE